jgi:hypothetical protein
MRDLQCTESAILWDLQPANKAVAPPVHSVLAMQKGLKCTTVCHGTAGLHHAVYAMQRGLHCSAYLRQHRAHHQPHVLCLQADDDVLRVADGHLQGLWLLRQPSRSALLRNMLTFSLHQRVVCTHAWQLKRMWATGRRYSLACRSNHSLLLHIGCNMVFAGGYAKVPLTCGSNQYQTGLTLLTCSRYLYDINAVRIML